MFAPAAADGGPATATRSRRRQRPKSTDSMAQQPKAKRQRLPLTEQTFLNPDAPPEMAEVRSDKVATLSARNSDVENFHAPTPRRELNTRAKKQKHAERAANKGDGSLLLTSTNAYAVSKLLALPDRIRSDSSGNLHADIFSPSGYALTLTSAHAIVWPYTTPQQSPETFTFNLPSASKSNDPLPVGCLVSPSAASTEPGLVVVMAGSGKVVYWESISSAATFDFIKRERSGVEHMIAGMSSGEKAVAITNAESAGFILTFNTGRLAYMNVRDGHGRPGISVQFLRTSQGAATGGLFGSIRHAFSHLSLRGDIAAVRADRSARVGERNIVALTSKGRLQAWKVHRGGHNEALGEADMREELTAALQETDPTSQDFSADSFEALDFTFVPKGLDPRYLDLSRLSDAMASDDPTLQHLLMLVSLTKKTESRYALIEVILTPNQCQIGMIRPLTSYSAPYSQSDYPQAVRPRVYLPRPALVAFVVFDRASVIASVAVPPESPDSQLQVDSHILPSSFEDVVDFREDNVHEIVGSGIEEVPSISQGHEETRAHRQKTKNPAVVLMVRGAGVMRIVTTDVDKFASDQPPSVSAKSKLEQAVFFGAKPDNPLVFGKRQGVKFSNDEMAHAALEISQEILSSRAPHMSSLPASMEENLFERSKALERLMLHLTTLEVDLDRRTRWKLLYNAEKMHVAMHLWRRHEAFTASRPADDKKSLVGMIVEFIHRDQKHSPIADIGEVDPVRHWFVNDIDRLELFVSWAYEVIKVLYKDHLLDDAKVTVMIHEAIQVNVCTHIVSGDFRKNHMDFYGLGNEELRMGILLDGYQGLPEPWTGSHYLANNAKRLTELADQWYNKAVSEEEQARALVKPDPIVVAKIANDLPALIDGMLTSVLEYARWGKTVPDQKSMAQNFVKAYHADRYTKPLSLAHAGHWDDGANIAEKHGCLNGLAEILIGHIEHLETMTKELGASPIEEQKAKNLRESRAAQLEKCFETYGQDFAFPTYEYLLKKGGVEQVLAFKMDKIGYKTQFLRSKPELARVSWINDVQQEQDVEHAADTLINLALHKEQQMWNKKIELSLAKLALLADAEEKAKKSGPLKVKADEVRNEAQLQKLNDELGTIAIQDMLFQRVSNSTFGAVDDAAALSFAMDAHSSNIPRRQKVLYQIFEDGMGRLLKHEVLDAMTLIDLLTMGSFGPSEETKDPLPYHPFWLALKVAANSCHSDEVKEAKRLIWRRAYTRDDWAEINKTSLNIDATVVNKLVETELCKAFADCIQHEDSKGPFRPVAPEEAEGAFTESLDRRFREFDAGFQSKLLDAMSWEDKLLRQYIEKHRVGVWVTSAFETARDDHQITLDEATAAGAAVVEKVTKPLPSTATRRSRRATSSRQS